MRNTNYYNKILSNCKISYDCRDNYKHESITTKPPPITNREFVTSSTRNTRRSISAPIKPNRAGCKRIHNESKISLTGFCQKCSKLESA